MTWRPDGSWQVASTTAPANHFSTHLQHTAATTLFALCSSLTIVGGRCVWAGVWGVWCVWAGAGKDTDPCCGKLSTNRSLPEQLGVRFQHRRRQGGGSSRRVFSSFPLGDPGEFASIAEGRPQGANSIAHLGSLNLMWVSRGWTVPVASSKKLSYIHFEVNWNTFWAGVKAVEWTLPFCKQPVSIIYLSKPNTINWVSPNKQTLICTDNLLSCIQSAA